MDRNVKEFMKCNDQSAVYSASTLDRPQGGGRYSMLNGRSFTMTTEQLRQLPDGYPRWMDQ